MKTRIWIAVGITLSLASAATALALASTAARAPSSLTSLRAAEAVQTRRLVLFTTDDAAGALLQLGDRTLEIEHLVLGMLPTGDVGVARLSGRWPDGSRLETAHPDETFMRLITRFADLPGTNLIDGATNERYLVEEASYCVNEHGYLAVYFWSGKDPAGRKVSFGSTTGAYCCSLISAIKCGLGTCTGECPPSPPCECSGHGSCLQILVTACRGGCAPGHPTCNPGACNGSLTNCGCQ